MKNTKLFYVLLILFLGSQMAIAQKFDKPAFKKGDFSLNAGIGILPTVFSPTTNSKIPPLTLGANYRLANNFSLGAFATYATTRFRSDLPAHAVIPRASDSEQLMVGLKAAAHYDFKKTSFYGGLLLGYHRLSQVTDIPESSVEDEIPTYPVKTKGKAVYTAFVGGQHMFTDHIGMFAEVGYAVSIINIGLTLKL